MATSVAMRSEREWAAFAAIDWADQKHFWRLVPAGSAQAETGQIENTPEAVEAWAAGLERRFAGRPIAVCLEQKRGALVYMLAKYAHLVLYPVHPTTAAEYRKTFCPSGAKADPSDTASLLDLLLRHRERLQELRPDTVETRLLQFLVERRRQAVDEKTRQTNRLVDCLKLYYPQVVAWFEDMGSPLVGDLLLRWPSLEQLQRAHPGTLRKFFQEHNCRGEERLQQRIGAIYHAVAATQDEAVLEAGRLTVAGLVAVIQTLRKGISVFDKRIAELVLQHPDRAIFGSLPGAGAALVPRLIVAFGTRRNHYQSAYEMLCYSGIGPVTEASGKTHRVVFRFHCPKFLRQTFQEYAQHSIRYSEWAKAYYDYLRTDKQKGHHAAVRALAFKWVRIIFRCWKDGKPYDEKIYLRSLRRRQALVGSTHTAATSSGWQTVAGFQKFSPTTS